ncbi:hypothetical protein HispidOSU_014540, partial [Sigmodon hispidus]
WEEAKLQLSYSLSISHWGPQVRQEAVNTKAQERDKQPPPTPLPPTPPSESAVKDYARWAIHLSVRKLENSLCGAGTINKIGKTWETLSGADA